MPISRTILFLMLSAMAWETMGQSLTRAVSLHCEEKPLQEVLSELEQNYDLSFAYSSSFVPVHKRITYSRENVPLQSLLDELLEGSSLEVKEHKGYVVLKPDPALEAEQDKLDGGDDPNGLDPEEIESLRKEREGLSDITPIPTPSYTRLPDYQTMPGGDRILTTDLNKYKREWVKADPDANPEFLFEEEEEPRTTSEAQLTLIPMVGTNLTESGQMTNKLSINILWGINGGVDGVEVGGFVNTIRQDVKGVQVAGLANTVNGRVEGTQVAGLFNVTGEDVSGTQVSGLFNVAGRTTAAQVAGLFNVSSASSSGAQVSLGFNWSREGGQIVQTSALLNVSRGDARTQASILYNRAKDVSGSQIGLLFNRGRRVKGIQLGLINVADTIEGAPIGLLNFVKKGYNRVELEANEAFWVNTGFKFGARSFYNIFHLGIRWGDPVAPENPGAASPVSWTLGYGIGTAFGMGSKWLMNLEGILQHVNEQESWTSDLNLLTRFRITADRKLGKHLSLFFGPNLSILASKRYDPETGTYHSVIPPYTLHQRTNERSTVSLWVGFGGGLRF